MYSCMSSVVWDWICGSINFDLNALNKNPVGLPGGVLSYLKHIKKAPPDIDVQGSPGGEK